MKLTIILILTSFTYLAQVNDSLLYQIQQIENDTERVNQLYKTGFNLRNTNPQLSYQYALVCQQEALKTKSAIHMAKSYNLLGVIFYKKSNYAKALEMQKKSLSLNKLAHNNYGIAINYTNLGNIYSDIHYLKPAEYSYLLALQAYNQSNNVLHICKSLINLGVLKYNQKQFNIAIKQFNEALTYANTINNNELIAACYNNIGTILREQNKLDSALLYLEESLKLKQLIGNEFELADSYNNLALVYIKQQNFDEANTLINLADTLCHKFDYTDALIELYHTHSLLCEAQNDFKQANQWLKKHYALKDSVQKINNENQEIVFFEENNYNISEDLTPKKSKNNWLLFSILLISIVIPLYLIRLKR